MIGGAIAAVVIGFWTVGSYASREEGFDWELASIFGTALGTTGLALFTGWLAWTTSGDLRSRERPVVVMESAIWHREPGDPLRSGTLQVRMRNVGLGPALRLVVECTYNVPVGSFKTTPSILAALLPGEVMQSDLPFSFQEPPPGGIQEDQFPVHGTFVDRAQRTEYKVITEWQSAPTMQWHDPNE